MKDKVIFIILGIYFFSLQTMAVEVNYSTFQITEGFYGVSAYIGFDSNHEKTVIASLEIDKSKKCGKEIHQLNNSNSFFIKKYSSVNIDSIHIKSESSPFWIIKVNDSRCINQSVINISIAVEEYSVNSDIFSSSTRVKLDDIDITDLKVHKLKYPVSLNDNYVPEQVTGIVYWGESDHFSTYGRLYFKFIWDKQEENTLVKTITDYKLECVNNKGKEIKMHDYLFPPTLIQIPSSTNQTIKLFPLVFNQGSEKEYYKKCYASIEYEYKGSKYTALGLWVND